MRISDWSSDVCYSDLLWHRRARAPRRAVRQRSGAARAARLPVHRPRLSRRSARTRAVARRARRGLLPGPRTRAEHPRSRQWLCGVYDLMSGILSIGAYVPLMRLQRAAVYEANKWFAPGLRGLAREIGRAHV